MGLLSASDLCLWTTSGIVEFEVDLRVGELSYQYKLVVDCNRDLDKSRVDTESLACDQKPLITRDRNEVRLFRDDGSEGGSFPLDWTRSAVAAVQPTSVNQKLQAFRNSASKWIRLMINPIGMEPESRSETSRPELNLTNAISWYRHLSANGKWAYEFTNLLRSLWHDFDYPELENVGRDTKALRLVFKRESRDKTLVPIYWDQLSEGERTLFVLYALVALIRSDSDSILLLDEPDNFVSASEIRPWLYELLECESLSKQIVLVSHNSQIVDFVNPSRVLWFSRASHDAATILRQLEQVEDGLTLSERVARGWVDG